MSSSSDLARPQVVYKILLQSQYQAWLSSTPVELFPSKVKAHLFTGAGIDIQDGYIHLSTASQGLGTYSKWFAPVNPAENEGDQATDKSGEPLVLVEIDIDKIVGTVKWELAKSRGEEFAHVYNGGIPYIPQAEDTHGKSAVLRIWDGEQVKKTLFDGLVNEQQ